MSGIRILEDKKRGKVRRNPANYSEVTPADPYGQSFHQKRKYVRSCLIVLLRKVEENREPIRPPLGED